VGATLTPSPALNSSDLNHITNYSYPDSSTVTKPTLKINDSHTLNTQTNLNHNFNVIIMNYQSIVPKKAQVACMIDTNDLDIIIATLTWLSSVFIQVNSSPLDMLSTVKIDKMDMEESCCFINVVTLLKKLL